MTASTPTARATLELDLRAHGAGERPAGALICADGRRRAFRGWLELAAAIEDWSRAYAHSDRPRGGR